MTVLYSAMRSVLSVDLNACFLEQSHHILKEIRIVLSSSNEETYILTLTDELHIFGLISILHMDHTCTFDTYSIS